ncbi:MAG: hypothetical protein EAZ24_02335 [Burkholderiales bacterium]|nr:MAG: hypothetical protein EAZ21_10405 [Betaproteobacteria bacterium]TAG83955.1 MAG: hypothetical protein EAZ24_02335 [Burkholderiales bacterium]
MATLARATQTLRAICRLVKRDLWRNPSTGMSVSGNIVCVRNSAPIDLKALGQELNRVEEMATRF